MKQRDFLTQFAALDQRARPSKLLQPCDECGVRYPLRYLPKLKSLDSQHGSRRIVCDPCSRGIPYARVLGVGSITQDGYHVPMWDFDGVPLKLVTWALTQSMELWGIHAVHIIQSSPGDNYQAISFDKISRTWIQRVAGNTLFTDSAYVSIYQWRRHYTLRVTLKRDAPLRYVRTLRRRVSARREESRPHYELYASVFPQLLNEVECIQYLDDCELIYTEGYHSRHVGKQH